MIKSAQATVLSSGQGKEGKQMHTGQFLLQFFEERDTVTVKSNNEADVKCPFPHDKGYETRPSAHINIDKGVFHCKTCRAEGRWNKGGLSETDFVSKYYNLSYAQAIQFMSLFNGTNETESWDQACVNLLGNTDALTYLTQERGLTLDTIKEYKLGYVGDGIVYPVFINGYLADERKYNMNWKKESEDSPGEYIPKIKSRKGASNLLFPCDSWRNDPKPTCLLAGENDTLLARQYGFNAVTVTFGEGSQFPKIFLNQFKDKLVYIIYDCDEAGKQGARQVAFQLKEAGARVKIVDLGLPGTKEDKDISDFFLKHNQTAEDLNQKLTEALDYTEELFIEDKEREYPIVPLWEIINPEHSNKYISSRVIMMGKYDRPMEIPTAIKWVCNRPDLSKDSSPCHTCRYRNGEGHWFLEDKNLKDVLYLAEVNEELQNRHIKQKLLHLPSKCPGVTTNILDRSPVQKVILSPDVETEDELSGYKGVEQYAYAVGKENQLEDGQRYRAFFKRYPHPLQNQFIVAIIDRVEESDNAINRFKITPEVVEELKQFQGHPNEVMKRRADHAKEIVGSFAPEMVAWTVDVMYHSAMNFKFGGRYIKKGYPEALIIGPSRTGKSDTALKLQQFYGVGNFTECKTATTAGLLGGADKLPSGGHRIKWGKIPRNHKGMLILDELSGMPTGIMATLTGLRSSMLATLEKIVSGKAPAQTRMLWISNPRVQSDGKSLNIMDYPNGVKIVLDLIGSDEDTARFDFVVILPNIEKYKSPLEDENDEHTLGLSREEYEKRHNGAYRNLIHWVWSRTSDQVKWGDNVEKYLVQRANELNEKFDTDVKFFGAEAWKKLARIAVAVAGCCFSHTDNGESILVTKEHVDWASAFLIKCYDNDVFRLPEYVNQTKLTTTTNPEVNAIVAGLIQSQPMLMKTLASQTETTLRQLQAVSGLDNQQFNAVFTNLVRHSLVQNLGKDVVMPTRRFRLAVKFYRENHDKQRLIPLSEQGGSFI